MKRTFTLKIATVAVIATLLAGCLEKKLDGTSDEAFKASVQEMKAGMTPEGLKQFEADLLAIAFSSISFKELMSGAPAAANAVGNAQSKLHGMTAAQIHQTAEQIRAERAERERQQGLQEIQELQTKRDQASMNAEKLKGFKVTRSRYYLSQDRYIAKPTIELDVTNNTDSPVSRAYFNATLATPGRAIPWFTKQFNYSIPGGLEPGESATWTLEPNYGWRNLETPDGAVFTVETYRIDGPDDKALYDAEGLSERETARLKQLQEKFGTQ